jgi:hypothetical protein
MLDKFSTETQRTLSLHRENSNEEMHKANEAPDLLL